MSVSPIDSLQPLTASGRAVEPPVGGEARPAFAPALAQACGPAARRNAQAAEDAAEPATPAADEAIEVADVAGEACDERADAAEEQTAAATNGEVAEAEESEEATNDEGDEAAISHAAAAAVANEPAPEMILPAVEASSISAAANGGCDAAADDGAESRQAERSSGTAKAIELKPQGATSAGAEAPRPAEGGGAEEAMAAELGDVAAAVKGDKSRRVGADGAGGEQLTAADGEGEGGAQPQAVAASVEGGDVGDDGATEDSGHRKATDQGEARGEVKATAEVAAAPLATEALAAGEGLVISQTHGEIAAEGVASAEVTSATPHESAGAAGPRTAATLDRVAAGVLRRSDGAGPPDGERVVDRARFVQRVEGALRAAQQRDGRVQVRLAPPELGALRIELAVQNGVMTAKVEAETQAARNALLDNLPVLRERLAEQNIRVEKFDVDLRRDAPEGGGPREQLAERREQDSPSRRGRNETAAKVAAPKAARPAGAATDVGIDVRV